MSLRSPAWEQRSRGAPAGWKKVSPLKQGVRGALLLLCCLSGSVPAWEMQPQASSSVSELAGKAKALELRGRSELAREAWEQVLRQDPGNAEALKGLIRASQATGRASEADTYLKRLREAHPDDPGLVQLSRQGSGADREAQTHEAEQLARAGKYPEAVAAYRRLYGANPPPGDVALRYYAAEGATAEGRPEAIASLRALMDQFPQDRRYRRALGSLLVLNARTEQEGEELLGGGSSRKSPTAVSLAALPAESPRPDAVQTPENVASVRAASPPAPQRVAEPGKQAVPKVTPAPLVLAKTTPPPGPDVPPNTLKPVPVAGGEPLLHGTRPVPLTTASTVSGPAARANAEEERAGYSALTAGRLREAEARFKVLLARDPENARALGGLGLLRLRQGDRVEAARLLQQAQDKGANDPALSRALQQTGASAGATPKVSDQVQIAAVREDAEAPKKVALPPPPLRPLEGLSLPKAASAVARNQRSGSKAETAAQNPAPPSPPAPAGSEERVSAPAIASAPVPSVSGPLSGAAEGRKQLELASSFLGEGKSAQAYAMFRTAIGNGEFENAQAWAGLFASLHASGHDREALAQAEAAPAAVRVQLESDPLYLETAAMIYAGENDRAHALSYWSRLQQSAAGQHTSVSAASSVEFARWLSGSGDETHLYAVLMALGGRSDLSDTQRRVLQRLWAESAVRQSAVQARAGELERAKQTLGTAATAFADNPEALRTLARGYAAISQPKTAVALLRAQDLANATAQEMAVAVNAALAAHDMKAAEAWLRSALPRFGRNSDLLLLASRFEQETGHKQESAVYLQAALSMAPGQNAPFVSGSPAKTVALAEVAGSPSAAPNLAALFTKARATENSKANAVASGSGKRPFLPSSEGSVAAAPAVQPTKP